MHPHTIRLAADVAASAAILWLLWDSLMRAARESARDTQMLSRWILSSVFAVFALGAIWS